jgi:type VI secretion system protein ImpA
VTSAPVLDLDALLRPIPGDNPAGEPLADTLRMELDTNRREPIPGDDTTNHWKADWPKVLRVTTEALTGKGKDIHAAARLVEAATKIHGAPGLRDGLRLLQRMIDECWDRMHPVPANGDTTDIRESPIIWLNDVGRGARFPQSVASLPLLKVGGATFSALDRQRKDMAAAFDEAVAAAKPAALDALRNTHADLIAARQALADLAASLSAKRVDPDGTPDYTSLDTPSNIGSAIERCVETVEEIAQKRGLSFGEAAAGGDAEGDGAPASGDGRTAGPTPGTRDGLYRQLGEIASALRRIEPHSPIPFLLERCVKLGAMPFPELMRAMIRENSAVDEVERLLGIEKKE